MKTAMDEAPDSKKAWALSQTIFPILNDFSTSNQEDTCFKAQFEELCRYMQANGLKDFLQQVIINQMERRFRDEIVPAFWSYFEKPEVHQKGLNQFYHAVKSLYDNYKLMDKIACRLELFRQATHVYAVPYNEESIHNAFKLILKATLFGQLHPDYQAVTMSFYETALRIQDADSYLALDCAACDQSSCHCLHLFQETNRKLGEMNLLEPLVGQTLTNLSYKYVYTHIQKMCKDNYDSSISRLETWLHSIVIVWLRKMYSFDTSICLNEAMDTFQTKLVNYLYNSYTKIRINQLFNIVIEYPESLPALEDIRLCLPRTDLKPLLMKKLQKAMETRLLHQGVSTADILTAYVATIKSLKVLDPTGLLLESVTYPIHQYLRKREDTVRCVMSSLTEEGPNDLAEELHKRGPTGDNVNVEDGNGDWETWTPDPIETAVSSKKSPKDKTTTSRRHVDIISMLVDIYGSNELFVNEYRNLLADRLLSQYTSDTEKEIRYLELLKLKFGDSNLHFCEVMLKDVVDSKRINQRIKEDSEYRESGIPLSTLIVSQQFWPPFKDEKLELHNKVLEQIKEFTSGFETLKGSRTLCWKSHLGVVNIEVELNDRAFNLSVSPMQATILMHFQDKNTWQLEELGNAMQCSASFLRRKIGFWMSHGILSETSVDTFSVQENVANKSATKIFFDEDFESESAMASVQDQKEGEFQNIWTYIVGMLKNLDSLPLDRIHHMLKMFAFQGLTTECSPSELKVFLDRKVRERLLIFSNNMYKLHK